MVDRRGSGTRRFDDRRRAYCIACASPCGQWSVRLADETAVAGYVADMTAQLESMAGAVGLDLLAYFLAMARAEAAELARAPCEAARAS